MNETLPRLERAFLAVLVAACTKPMSWFSAAHAFLHHVSKGTRSQLLQLIALLLCVPCFKASHLLFKLAFELNLFRMRRSLKGWPPID